MANKKRQKKTKKPNLPRDVRAAKEAEIKNRGKKPGKEASKGANTAVMVVATVLLFVGLFMLITGYNDYLAMKRGR